MLCRGYSTPPSQRQSSARSLDPDPIETRCDFPACLRRGPQASPAVCPPCRRCRQPPRPGPWLGRARCGQHDAVIRLQGPAATSPPVAVQPGPPQTHLPPTQRRCASFAVQALPGVPRWCAVAMRNYGIHDSSARRRVEVRGADSRGETVAARPRARPSHPKPRQTAPHVAREMGPVSWPRADLPIVPYPPGWRRRLARCSSGGPSTRRFSRRGGPAWRRARMHFCCSCVYVWYVCVCVQEEGGGGAKGG